MAKRPVQLRIDEEDLAEIDRRARERGMNRSAFLVSLALDQKHKITDAERRLNELESRVAKVERGHVRLTELL